MSPIVTISGGGFIGNYISARLNKNNIETIVIEKSEYISHINENIRTLTNNAFPKLCRIVPGALWELLELKQRCFGPKIT